MVDDVISELCKVIGIDTENEMEEFSLYCIVEGETFNVPLTKDHYILDVTTGLYYTSRYRINKNVFDWHNIIFKEIYVLFRVAT